MQIDREKQTVGKLIEILLHIIKYLKKNLSRDVKVVRNMMCVYI